LWFAENYVMISHRTVVVVKNNEYNAPQGLFGGCFDGFQNHRKLWANGDEAFFSVFHPRQGDRFTSVVHDDILGRLVVYRALYVAEDHDGGEI
jgi:hypothetical protein